MGDDVRRDRVDGFIVRFPLILLFVVGCTPNATPHAPKASTAPSRMGEFSSSLDTSWVRGADRLDFTYVEADPASSYEIHARLERIDRTFEIVADLTSQCPAELLPKCTTTRRLVHRHAELPESAIRPLLEAVARARSAPSPNTIRIPEGEGTIRRSLVITASNLGGGARVLAVGAEDGEPLELGTDRRWSVDEPSAKTIRTHLDELVKALALREWIHEEAERWARSP
jgi:hypothetical protein